ncbi:MAG: Hsp70 family protein [Phycisphaera sp. RhM]|nr:Hsp70 family protein [Phycisphaera sp. RhM]
MLSKRLSIQGSETPTSKPHKPLVVGIDLGTTYSAVAYVDDRGQPHTIINSEGDLTTPSAALIENQEVTIGKLALKAQITLPGNVATFAKRDIGKPTLSHPVDGRSVAPEVIESLILGRLKRDAETKLGRPITQAVITVPAYFNEPKRRSTIRAAELAGLDVLSIINEPTAAAIAYGIEKHSEILGPQTVLIYDLGGGTFDVSMVKVDHSNITVVATDGNAMLGGIDWDRCLVKWLDDQFAQKCKFRPSEVETGAAWLMQEATELKHALTSRTEVKIRLTFQSSTLITTITRSVFEDLTAHLLDRTRFTVRKLMKDSATRWEQIDQVILVGGSTRLPQVAEMITALSGMEPNRSISADEAIAHGAAIYASTIQSRAAAKKTGEPDSGRLVISDVNAHNLGVLGIDLETRLSCNYVMIQRNTPIPVKQTTRFQTLRDDQRSVAVEIVEGGDSRGRYGTHIGKCVLGHLPAQLPAGTPVDVTFRYDRDGLMQVEAKLPATGQQASIQIERHSTNVPSETVDPFDPEWSIL